MNRQHRVQKKAGAHASAFFVPATEVISIFFLEDLEMTWALREVFPILLNSKILNNHFEKQGENYIIAKKSREKIIELLKTHPEYSARKLAETIGITDKAVEKHLAKLKVEGLIQRDGPDKGGKWIVN